jgi:hypothetical protein
MVEIRMKCQKLKKMKLKRMSKKTAITFLKKGSSGISSSRWRRKGTWRGNI